MPLYLVALLLVAAPSVGWQWIRHNKREFHLPPIRLIAMPLIGLGLQVAAIRWPSGMERTVLFASSQMVLLVFFAANLRYWPIRILFLGFILNFLPMVLNGGYMPITPEAMASIHPGTQAGQWATGLVRTGSKDIVLPASQAALWFLGDVFTIGRPFPLWAAFSIGDCVIVAGFGWTVAHFGR